MSQKRRRSKPRRALFQPRKKRVLLSSFTRSVQPQSQERGDEYTDASRNEIDDEDGFAEVDMIPDGSESSTAMSIVLPSWIETPGSRPSTTPSSPPPFRESIAVPSIAVHNHVKDEPVSPDPPFRLPPRPPTLSPILGDVIDDMFSLVNQRRELPEGSRDTKSNRVRGSKKGVRTSRFNDEETDNLPHQQSPPAATPAPDLHAPGRSLHAEREDMGSYDATVKTEEILEGFPDHNLFSPHQSAGSLLYPRQVPSTSDYNQDTDGINRPIQALDELRESHRRTNQNSRSFNSYMESDTESDSDPGVARIQYKLRVLKQELKAARMAKENRKLKAENESLRMSRRGG